AFNHTLAALRLSKKANVVSAIHGDVACEMWGSFEKIAPIDHVTNSQNWKYWADEESNLALAKKNDNQLRARKIELKKGLFKIVADHCGKLFEPEVLTIVWARRFAAYKRADLLAKDLVRFESLLYNDKYPVQ